MFMNSFQADLRVRHNHVDALEQCNVGHFVCSTVEKKIVLPMSATNFIDP